MNPNFNVDVAAIVAANPKVDPDSVARTEALVRRLSRLGIKATGYRLASPFSSSLKIKKMRREKCKICGRKRT